MTAQHLVVVGSGALARSVCAALACRVSPVPVRVTVLARDSRAAAVIARGCTVRAATSGTGTAFAAASPGDLPATLAELRPDLVVCCASAHSPYERLTDPSPWTDLVQRAGFGLTLPLQAELVVAVARALRRSGVDALLVNGCFPDVVNPLLAELDLPVHCGIGNVATLAACLQATLGLADQRALALLGHHANLAEPVDPELEVRVWHDGVPVPRVTALLRADRALPRRDLNAIGGHAAAGLLLDLAAASEVHANLPGPGGLPGGYPVRVAGRSIELNLPNGVDRAGAIAWNLRAGEPDGVRVTAGRVRHSPSTAAAIEPHLPELAAGWPVGALDEVTRRFTVLRHQLRASRQAPAMVPTESH